MSTAGGNSDEVAAFVRMARAFPMRTVIFSFGLPVFACLQVVNALLHDGSLVVVSGFAVLMVAFAVQLTRYQVAVFRRRQLSRPADAPTV